MILLIRFLGYVDLRGTTYQSSTIATGFGAHLAVPILRKRVEGREDDLTEEEAIEIINDCMRVLYYRDARSMNKVNQEEFIQFFGSFDLFINTRQIGLYYTNT